MTGSCVLLRVLVCLSTGPLLIVSSPSVHRVLGICTLFPRHLHVVSSADTTRGRLRVRVQVLDQTIVWMDVLPVCVW
jgi:hypothetical protein